jgi:hypothetical protein
MRLKEYLSFSVLLWSRTLILESVQKEGNELETFAFLLLSKILNIET